MSQPYCYYTVHRFYFSDLAPVEDIWAEAQSHNVGLHRRGDQYVFTLSEPDVGPYLTQFVLHWGEWILEDRAETWVI